jgi:hypothetical protein
VAFAVDDCGPRLGGSHAVDPCVAPPCPQPATRTRLPQGASVPAGPGALLSQ